MYPSLKGEGESGGDGSELLCPATNRLCLVNRLRLVGRRVDAAERLDLRATAREGLRLFVFSVIFVSLMLLKPSLWSSSMSENNCDLL